MANNGKLPIWIVTCSVCGLVTTNTEMRYARKNAGEHYDEHAGQYEVKTYEAFEIATLDGI